MGLPLHASGMIATRVLLRAYVPFFRQAARGSFSLPGAF